MGEFRMPSLGADMTEGTLLEWQVKPGDHVHRGDVVAVIDTDKAAIEVEVFEDGVVEELLVAPGTKVPVGTPLAMLNGGTSAPAATPPAAPAVPEPRTAEPPPPAAEPAPPAVEPPPVRSPLVRHLAQTRGVDLTALHGSGADGAITRADVERAGGPRAAGQVSPRARRLAAELGVDLAGVVGTGPDGSVTGADVEAAARRTVAPAEPMPEQPAPPQQAQADRALAMRHAVGELMARSKREIPHYYLSHDVDMAAAMTWLREVNAGRPVQERLVPAALVLKATAVAVHAVPEVNGWWVDGRHETSDHVHLGVAVSLRPSGLVAPAILDADTLDLDTLMARLRDLVKRARAGRLRQQEMAAPTLTVTNLGDNGVDAVFGVIYAPQVALVGVGQVRDRPWAVDGMLGVRPVVTLTLSADHRASDGHRGSRYLQAIADLLQRPAEL